MNKIYVDSGWLEQTPLIGIYTVDRTRNSASFAYDAEWNMPQPCMRTQSSLDRKTG